MKEPVDWGELLRSQPLKRIRKLLRSATPDDVASLLDLSNRLLALLQQHGPGEPWRHGHLGSADLSALWVEAESLRRNLSRVRTRRARMRECELGAPSPTETRATLLQRYGLAPKTDETEHEQKATQSPGRSRSSSRRTRRRDLEE